MTSHIQWRMLSLLSCELGGERSQTRKHGRARRTVTPDATRRGGRNSGGGLRQRGQVGERRGAAAPKQLTSHWVWFTLGKPFGERVERPPQLRTCRRVSGPRARRPGGVQPAGSNEEEDVLPSECTGPGRQGTQQRLHALVRHAHTRAWRGVTGGVYGGLSGQGRLCQPATLVNAGAACALASALSCPSACTSGRHGQCRRRRSGSLCGGATAASVLRSPAGRHLGGGL